MIVSTTRGEMDDSLLEKREGSGGSKAREQDQLQLLVLITQPRYPPMSRDY